MARKCAKCGEGFGFQDIPFGYKDLYVHTWHFDNLSACSDYLKTFDLPDVDGDDQTATEWSLKKDPDEQANVQKGIHMAVLPE
jgi:hypothetical protein